MKNQDHDLLVEVAKGLAVLLDHLGLRREAEDVMNAVMKGDNNGKDEEPGHEMD